MPSIVLPPKPTALQKPHLNLAVVGHVDNGKSTLVGRLLYETGYVDEKAFKEIEEMAKKMGKEDFAFAWILDRFKEERERGVTIEATHVGFETSKLFITIIDLPGHRDFVKNMIVGASQADAALFVISARPGEFEAAIGPQGQGREHLFLIRTLGIMKLEQAQPGDNVGVNVRGIGKEDVKRGDVLGRADNIPTVAEEIVARIVVLWHPTAIGPGYAPVMHIHTATVPVQITELISKLDPRTGQAVEQKPQFIKQGDVALVKIKPLKPVVAEKFSEFPALGRFALRDMGRTIAAGQIIEVKPAQVQIK